ncbi:hypothetical protein F2Q68_00037961 [Brassica cretica]|uniref:Uncharacterized protein n=1 Tax=Brassica cretica TaxID=69181 RepID=A0A8S9H4G7_BRACR|nr:hypothetical protein F2Q68_00037961 [Brassica cretica]
MACNSSDCESGCYGHKKVAVESFYVKCKMRSVKCKCKASMTFGDGGSDNGNEEVAKDMTHGEVRAPCIFHNQFRYVAVKDDGVENVEIHKCIHQSPCRLSSTRMRLLWGRTGGKGLG